MPNVCWTAKYPNPEILRREVQLMLDAFVEALLAHIPASEITGIYFKGSAQKQWDSPLDYVPEINDVDVHLLFRDSEVAKRRLDDVEMALAIQAQVGASYRKKVPKPIHIPRPQLIIANWLMEDPAYCPPAEGTVTTLFGDDHPVQTDGKALSAKDRARQNLLRHDLLTHDLTSNIIDKPDLHLRPFLLTITWRVSKIAPNVLCLLGLAPEEAWSLNRTRLLPLLAEFGEPRLMQSLESYYLSTWDYFLSGYADSEAARAAIRAGVGALRESMAIAAR